MTNVRLKDFGSLAYAGMAADDLVYMADHDASDGERKATLADIKKYALGNVAIGGSAAGDIITNNATQTMTNKTLISPTIGTSVALPATITIGGTALTPSVAELNFVDGVTRAIQTQLNELAAQISAMTTRVWNYGKTFVAAGSSADEITAATILAGAAVPSGYIINPITVVVQMSTVSGGTFTKIDEVTAAVVWESTTDGHGTYLTKVKPSLVNGTTYNISINFKVVADAL